MKVIKQYEENGYIITEFENGNIEKIIKSDAEEVPTFTEKEIVDAQILNKLDYLECLLELNMLKGGN